ncbi:MAG: hypothetical protein ACHQ9S_14050 [Candidatus Binatia bacterium]
MTHADDTLRRLETLAAATQAREAHTTELLDRLSADRDALTASVRDVEQRVVAVAAQHDSRLEELRQLIDQAQLEQRHVEAEARARAEQAAARADEAFARADETVRRLETVAAASQAREARTTELLDRLSAGWDVLTSSVRAAEQRLAALAARQEASTGPSRNDIEAVRSVEPQESSIPAGPGSFATGVRVVNERLQARASWLMLTAPGILLALVLLSLGLIAAPWLTRFVQVAPGVRSTAAALLLAHGVARVLAARRGRWWPAAVAFTAVLALDAFCAGLLLGADLQAGSPAIAICLAVLAMSLMAGGWPVGLGSVLALCAGIGTAMSRGLTPLLLSPVMWLPTTLSVETSFANAPAPAVTAPAFLTTLSVETLYGGSPVVFGSSVPLFMPVLAIILLAISIGAGLNLLRARKARAAVAATIVAAHRCMVRG